MTEALAASSEATDGVSPRDCVKTPTKTCDLCSLKPAILLAQTFASSKSFALLQEMKEKWAEAWQVAETTYAGESMRFPSAPNSSVGLM